MRLTYSFLLLSANLLACGIRCIHVCTFLLQVGHECGVSFQCIICVLQVRSGSCKFLICISELLLLVCERGLSCRELFRLGFLKRIVLLNTLGLIFLRLLEIHFERFFHLLQDAKNLARCGGFRLKEGAEAFALWVMKAKLGQSAVAVAAEMASQCGLQLEKLARGESLTMGFA